MGKIDQVAFYSMSPVQDALIKQMFSLENAEWKKDHVVARGSVMGNAPVTNEADLQFNYTLGVELEILRYTRGPCWHVQNPLYKEAFNGKGGSFLSHIGIHLGKDEPFPEMKGYKLVQEVWTESHTSEYLKSIGRTYHYRIHEVSPGTYVKYIKRIEKGIYV